MFDNIVIGVDGRDGGRRAIALARQLAAEDADITLANVYGIPRLPGQAAVIALMWESEASEALLERERDRAGLAEAAILRSSEPSVGRGLHEIAEHVRADLLVIGSTRRPRAGRAILGDDTADVLHGAPCPVAIVPLDCDPSEPPAAIGTAYDGSPESSQALAGARLLAERFGASLRVMTVVPVSVKAFWEPPERSPEVAEREAALSKAGELQDVRVRIIEGDPSERLTSWSEELDLLVLGSRSQGFLGRALTGSVASQLALNSACPVLIWPRSAVRAQRMVEQPEASKIKS